MIVTDLSNSFNPVPKTNAKNVKETSKSSGKNVRIKQKSNKLARLERNRFSIITDDLEHCYICKKKKMDLHEIFRGSNRQACMKYGLVIPVCRICHDSIQKNKTLSKKLYEVAKKEFKKQYKNENFIQIFGKSFEEE